MKGERTLKDKPFRYGGIMRDYSKTARAFCESPKCHCCGESMDNGNALKMYPYAGFFKITKGINKGYYRIRLLCRQCAYAYGRGVIERDGNTYQRPIDYKGRIGGRDEE